MRGELPLVELVADPPFVVAQPAAEDAFGRVRGHARERACGADQRGACAASGVAIEVTQGRGR